MAEITEANQITDKLFVYKTEKNPADDYYDRVATPYDIQTYPEVRDAGVAFYRVKIATLVIDDISTAQSAKDSIPSSVTRTLKEYSVAQESFVGVTLSNLSSE